MARKGARRPIPGKAAYHVAPGAVGYGDDGKEGGQVGDRVGHQVEENAAGAYGGLSLGDPSGNGSHPRHQEACVGNGAIGQHPLDVALGNGHQVTYGHREGAKHGEEGCPVQANLAEGKVEHPENDREARGLAGHR